MTFHTRSSWNAKPSARPLVAYAAPVLGVAIHWNGPPVSRMQRPVDVVRSTQAFHMGPSRGWRDIAYNLAVDWQGDVWEGRGVHATNGAHDNDTANTRYVAIEVMTGEGQAITAPMIAGVADAIALTRQAWPTALAVTPHSQWTATACPGDELRRLIAAGTWATPVPSAPTPTPPPEEQDMGYILFTLDAKAVAERKAPRGLWLVGPSGEKFPVTTPETVGGLDAAGMVRARVSYGYGASLNFLDNHP